MKYLITESQAKMAATFLKLDMKKFIHQSILLMADTLQRSTGEIAMAETMRDFGAYYAEKLGIISPSEN